jgi:heme exporter protein D
MNRIWLAIAVGLGVMAAGVAVADSLTSSRQSDYFAPGKHQFYVWCSGGGDYTAVQRGSSAEDAQMKLYNGIKTKACWPVWQGKVAG